MKEIEIINRCRAGERLCKVMWRTSVHGAPHTDYSLEPSGKCVGERQALGLLERGLFSPSNAGLPEMGNPQILEIERAA
jgi:hypothetical protein